MVHIPPLSRSGHVFGHTGLSTRANFFSELLMGPLTWAYSLEGIPGDMPIWMREGELVCMLLNMNNSDTVRENRLRRMAKRQGLALIKSRSRDPRAIGFGCFIVINDDTGAQVYGGAHDYFDL